MKFMKLGSRPDTFYTTEAVRSVSSEVSSDLIIQVKGYRYLLHKFPLLSKCLHLQRLCSESPEASHLQIIQLPDFPGGPEAFELCAKFCYGITITLSAYNIVSARCGAAYLQMTEEAEKGNLIYKLEVFFNSCILHGWRDSIVALQTSKAFHLWSEQLGIPGKCIDSIASKVISDPTKASLSQSYSRKQSDDMLCNGADSNTHKPAASGKGWWAEHLAELGIDLYWRTMIAIKSDEKVPARLIGDALCVYASRWLPDVSKYMKMGKQVESDSEMESGTSKHRIVLEAIIGLLPAEKGAVSCSFMLKLLKSANVLNASSSSKTDLARRIALQLEEATVGDMLVPCSSSTNGTMYDVDVVLTILEQFMLQGQSPPTSPPGNKKVSERRRSQSTESIDLELQESRRRSSASHGSKLKVAKLVDGYLQEIAKDKSLTLSKFITIAEAIPGFARPNHDELYKAIDIYLKGHPELNKHDRKRLCRILDCKKLSMEACMHAAQNEMLPLRVVVQVLFFEQARATMAGGKEAELPNNIKAILARRRTDQSMPKSSFSTSATMPLEDQWSVSGLKSPKSNVSTLKKKLAEDEELDDNFRDRTERSSKVKSLSMIPSRPKRMFSKLWPINRTASEKN